MNTNPISVLTAATAAALLGLGCQGAPDADPAKEANKKAFDAAASELKKPAGLIAAYLPYLDPPDTSDKYAPKRRNDAEKASAYAADEIRHAANGARQTLQRSETEATKPLVAALGATSAACADRERDSFSPALPYLTFPCLLWLAVRRGPSGAALSSLALSGIGIWQTVRGRGPFAIAGFTTSEHIPAAQIFLCVTVLSALVVAAVMSERMSLEEALKQQAERLSASLAEKEVLLREIHHRVKNNLQVISSMLHLQLMQVSEPAARTQLRDCERRVRAMALVHEQLYTATDLTGIEFSGYVDRLVTMLMRAYGSSQRRVTARISVAPLLVDIDTAMPCGLLVNELVSNSMKHAFPGDRQGEVCVSFARAGPEHLVLSVRDTGIGLPPEIDIESARTMGLQLIRAFTAQLGGTLRCERRNGTEISVLFPCPAALREVLAPAG